MRIVKNLTFQVIVAIICGIAVGAIWPSVGQEMKPIGETFINMIKMVIAPIIFLTIVLGIASMGSMKKVGRVGGKALLYFEIVTTAALIIGIIVANVVRPGDGLDPSKLKGGDVSQYVQSGQEMKWMDFFLHIVPSNMFEAFAKGDILQVLFFSILFGAGLTMLGKNGQPVIDFFERLSKVFFNILSIVMKISTGWSIRRYGVYNWQIWFKYTYSTW